MLGSPILYLKGMRIMMFQFSGFYCNTNRPRSRNPKPTPTLHYTPCGPFSRRPNQKLICQRREEDASCIAKSAVRLQWLLRRFLRLALEPLSKSWKGFVRGMG